MKIRNRELKKLLEFFIRFKKSKFEVDKHWFKQPQ